MKSLLIVSLLCFCVLANSQTSNLLKSGDMENGSWSSVPKNTDMVMSFEAGSGLEGSQSLKASTTDMGGSPYYIILCDNEFSLQQGDKITISFWAKGSIDSMRLQPWVQENGDTWQNYADWEEACLTTEWVKYEYTVNTTTDSGEGHKVKFRGYNTGTIYIDDVQIGPVDYEDVNKSDIYEVSISQDGKTWPITTFQNSCPEYQAGFENMEPKDEEPLGIFAGRSINWTKFSFEDTITVNVKVLNTTKVPVLGETLNVYPSRHQVAATSSNDSVVTFTITEPGQYSLEIGDEGYKNGLMIFSDPKETDVPSKSDVDNLVLHESTSNDIDSIPENYTSVYFASGVHDIGIFKVPSHIKKIYFEDGSWVYGALLMDGNPDVRIYGRGVLSSANMDYREAHCVEAINGSDNIAIEGLVVADPKYFAIRLIGRNNNVSYTKVIGGWVYNCDGIAAFKGSTVSKCFIWANDDAIKAYRDNITFSDIVVWQLNNGGTIQMGWGGAIGGSTATGVKIQRVDVLRAEWDTHRFNVGLLNCVGNRYEGEGRYALVQDWLIEDVRTENPIPLIFKVTPNEFTHTHIHGLTLRNWDVEMPMNTSFRNQIQGTDANEYFDGFVFDSVMFNSEMMTNLNFITLGGMNNGGWEGIERGTDQVVNVAVGNGVNGSYGLKSIVTNMGGDNYYAMKCNAKFRLENNEEITVSFWAKSNQTGTGLTPWIQESDSYQWMNIGNAALTKSWQRYAFSTTMEKVTSDNYQIKFRGSEVAEIFIDSVQIGPKDWQTLTKMETRYLALPTFLPELKSGEVISTDLRKSPSKQVSVYPNPAIDRLYFSIENSDKNFTIYNLQGRTVIKGFGEYADVSSLKPGMYFISINDGPIMRFIKT